MSRERLVAILIGAVIAMALIVPLGALAFIKSGIYDVAGSKPHSKFTEWVTHETMIHSVRSHAKGIEAPTHFSAAAVQRGFCSYEAHCVACHGASGVARQHWAGGFEPSPPYLLDASRRWRPRELFWIAKNGIKMTGMPSWRDTMSDGEIWEVVAFLEAMPKLDSQSYLRLRAKSVCRARPSAALVPSGSTPQAP